MMGAYPHNGLFMPPWGLSTGFQENHPANVSAMNHMPFPYPASYIPQQLQHNLAPQIRPGMQAHEVGDTSVSSRALLLSSAPNGGDRLTSNDNPQRADIACVSAMSASIVSGVNTGLVPVDRNFFPKNVGQWLS